MKIPIMKRERRLGADSLACVRGKYSWRALGQSLEGALRAVAVPTSPRPGPA